MPQRGVRSLTLGAAVMTLGCAVGGDGPIDPRPCVGPVVSRSTVAPNPTNVLSAFVSAEVRHADTVVVRFGVDATLDSVTPAFAANGDSVTAPILGLRPETMYGARVIAFNGCGSAKGDVVAFETGPLPPDLPAYTASGGSPSPGYVVISAGMYGLVLDNTGRVVWYRRFPSGPGLNFQAQPNGRYVARPSTETGSPPTWVEVAPDGVITRTLGCARGLAPRMHDLLAEPDGSYWVLCDELHTLDLSAQGDSPHARVLGTAVQRRSATGEVLFEWSPFDHFDVELAVLELADRSGSVINWTHGNALDLDDDGNLLVSFRNLSEVTKIDTRTHAVMWRLGGARNEFRFTNGTVPPFARQHGVRALGGGQVLLLDNLGHPLGSRAERYSIDAADRRVTLSGSHGASAGLVAQVGGTTQALPNGNTLVSFGSGGGVEEYDASGRMVWQLTGNPGYIFRAQRIRSLYSPGVGDPR
jgi:hypothetical protein